MIGKTIGALLAMYFLVGRWSFDRLDGGIDTESLPLQPRVWIIGLLAAIVFVVRRRQTPDGIRAGSSPIDFAVCLFFCYMLVTAVWAPDHELAIDKATELVMLLVVALVIGASRDSLSHNEIQDGFWLAIVVAGAAMASLAILSGTGGRVYMPSGGPNTFGRNMGLMGLGAAYLLGRCGTAAKPVCVALMIVAMLLVLMSGSRGGLLATCVGALALLVTARQSMGSKVAAVGALALIGMVILLNTSGGKNAREVFEDRIVEQTFQQRYLAGRDDLWLDAVDWIQERPWFGLGLNGYRANSWTYPHNIFLEVTVEGGIVGLLLLLNITRVGWTQLKMVRFRVPRAPLAALALLTASAQSSGDLFDSRGIFLLIALIAPATVVARHSIPRRPKLTPGVQRGATPC
jgi:O-antigen ligase